MIQCSFLKTFLAILGHFSLMQFRVTLLSYAKNLLEFFIWITLKLHFNTVRNNIYNMEVLHLEIIIFFNLLLWYDKSIVL